jgi:hypothetical protein
LEPPIDLLVYSKEDVSVAPIPVAEAAEAAAEAAEMGLMKGEGEEDLVERLSGVSPLLIPAEAAAAAAAVCSAAAAAAALRPDDETVVAPLEPAAAAAAAAAATALWRLRLLLAFGVDDLGMKDEANGEPTPAMPPLFAGILVISTRSIDGE